MGIVIGETSWEDAQNFFSASSGNIVRPKLIIVDLEHTAKAMLLPSDDSKIVAYVELTVIDTITKNDTLLLGSIVAKLGIPCHSRTEFNTNLMLSYSSAEVTVLLKNGRLSVYSPVISLTVDERSQLNNQQEAPLESRLCANVNWKGFTSVAAYGTSLRQYLQG